jgi:hypothetical protein
MRISLEEAATSWYEAIFLPTIQILRGSQNILLQRFPGRGPRRTSTPGSSNTGISSRRKYGDLVSIEDAAVDFSERFGKSIWRQIWEFLFRKKVNRIHL